MATKKTTKKQTRKKKTEPVTDLAEVKPKHPGGRPKGSKDKQKRKPPYWLERKPVPLLDYKALSPQAKKEVDAMEDGTNKRILEFSIALDKIRAKAQADKEDLNNLQECFDAYKALCFATAMRPTNASAYYALGFSASTFAAWQRGHSRGRDPAYARFGNDVLAFCAMCREQLAVEGKLNTIQGIWWQKAYDGLSDQPKEEMQTEERQEQSAEEIAEKYKNIPID